MNSVTETEKLVNTKQAGEFVCLSERTLQGFRSKGEGPKYVKISIRCVRYRLCDLQEWVAQKLRNSTSEAQV